MVKTPDGKSIYRLARSQQLSCDIHTAWAFFSIPANLARITPPDMKFTVGSDNANQPVHQGMVVDFRVTPLFGILIRWQSRITQVDAPRSFTDIQTKGPYKQAIINNADCKILLDQSKYENRFDQLQDMLGLNDRQKALILSMNRDNDSKRIYKEVYVYPPGKVYRIEVSLEEYLTYTTEESEKKSPAIHRQIRKHQKSIQALADDMRSGTATDIGRPSLTISVAVSGTKVL